MHLERPTDPTTQTALLLGPDVLRDVVLPTAVSLEKTLARTDDEPAFQALWPTLLETTLFCCHCIDRLAFARFRPDRRQLVMDCVLLSMVESLCNRCETPEQCDEVCDAFFSSWTKFQQTYSPMALTSEHGGSPQHTVLWEWAKNVTFQRNIVNPATGLFVFEHAAGMFAVLSDSWDALWVQSTS